MIIALAIAAAITAGPAPINNPSNPNFNSMRFDTPLTQPCSYALKHTQNKTYNPEGIWHGCYDRSNSIVIDESGAFLMLDKATLHNFRVVYKTLHYDFSSIHSTPKGYQDALKRYGK